MFFVNFIGTFLLSTKLYEDYKLQIEHTHVSFILSLILIHVKIIVLLLLLRFLSINITSNWTYASPVINEFIYSFQKQYVYKILVILCALTVIEILN